MEPIDISSSSDTDSDWDLEHYIDNDTPPTGGTSSLPNPRILPQWASVPGSSSSGTSGQSQSFTLPKRTSTSNGRSLDINRHSHPSSLSDNFRSSNQNISQANGTKLYIDNGNVSRAGTSDAYGEYSSEDIPKRTLPSSIQPFRPIIKSNNFVKNVDSSQVRSPYGKSRNSHEPSSSNGKRNMNDHASSGTGDDIFMYENGGSRILPQSLTHGKGKPSPTPQFASSSDHVYRPGVGEEREADNDERLIYQAALQDLNQPKVQATLPDGLLSIKLLRHQKIALAWMLQKETRSLHCLGGILADDQGLGKTISMIALIQYQRFSQFKKDSENINKDKTEALNLDDDDDDIVNYGLQKVEPLEESRDVKPRLDSTPVRGFSRQRPAAGTLVVCPASVLRQWSRELEEKVHPDAKLTVVIYHGGSRTKDPVELAKFDVVLTTYAIVCNEVPKQPVVDEEDSDDKNGERYGISSEFAANRKRKKTAMTNVKKKGKKGRKQMDHSSIEYGCGALSKVNWLRVILDEAQTIKNHRTQVARACCSLRAKRRWCLSGTPIQNSIDDLYSYFRYLRYDPYAVYKSFYNQIKVPISRNSIQGYKKLQAVLTAIMLRRTKGTFIDGEPIINLPPKTVSLNKVDFSPEERAFYSKLEADSRSQFKAYAAAGTLNQNYANILLMLLRLRQACDHPLLVKGFNTDSVEKDSLEMAKNLPRDMIMNLLKLLETSLAICHVCNDPPEDAVITMCGHAFCYQCVSEYLTGEENTCPVPNCREQLGKDIVFTKTTLRSCLSSDIDSSPLDPYPFDKSIVLQKEYSSSKVKAVLEILQSKCKVNRRRAPELLYESTSNGSPEMPTEPSVKAIVFSQWTSMLDLVEMSLKQTYLRYRRLDGTMSLAARDKAVKDFNNNPEVTVMLMSLKAGNLGLNMVAASHVILLDLWWNPTTEDQAVDRAHRIGQTRPVTVSRLTIKDTVEDRILALQEEKRKMVASAYGEDHGSGSAVRLTVDDLKYLFMGF